MAWDDDPIVSDVTPAAAPIAPVDDFGASDQVVSSVNPIGTTGDSLPSESDEDALSKKMEYAATHPSMVNGIPQIYINREKPTPAKQTSFAQDMGTNFDNAVQDAKDLGKGNYIHGLEPSLMGPKETTLTGKLLQGLGDDPSIGNILATSGKNILSSAMANSVAPNDNPNLLHLHDFSGALTEKFGQTPEGKALGVLNAHPMYNAINTAANKYAFPAISQATGIHPDNLNLMAMVAPTFGIKKAGEITDPLTNAVKWASKKMGEESGGEPIAALGNATGKGIGNIVKGFKARTPEEYDANAQSMRDEASGSFNAMRQAGAQFNLDAVNNIIKSIGQKMASSGKMNDSQHAGTISVMKQMAQEAKEKGGLDLEDLHQYQQLLGDVARQTNEGKATPDAMKATQALHEMDDGIHELGEKDLAGSRNFTADDLEAAKQERIKLQDLHDELENSVKEQADKSTKQGGFWRRRSITGAANEAKSLANVRQQIRNHEALTKSIEDELSNAPAAAEKAKAALEALDKGKQGWAKYRKFQRVADIIKNAGGDHFAIKRDLRNFVKKAKNLRGFTTAEKQALIRASQSTTGEGLLKMMGKAGFDIGGKHSVGNSVLPLIESGAAFYGATGALPAVIAGTAARYASKMMARGKAENALNVIENGAPEAKPVETPVSNAAPVNKTAAATNTAAAASLAPKTEMIPEPKPVAPKDMPKEIAKPAAPPVEVKPTDDLSAIAAQNNIDPAFFKKLSGAESPRDPTKPNPPSQQQKGSHAAGLYQFEPGTWKEMVDKYGAKYGVGINDIYKPKANAQMAAEYLKENHTALKQALGREPTKGELYAAHFLGADGALSIIRNKTSNQPATLFARKDQVRANPDIFYKGTSPRSVHEVYKILAKKVN